jgi:hypothetical protein
LKTLLKQRERLVTCVAGLFALQSLHKPWRLLGVKAYAVYGESNRQHNGEV